MRQRLCCEGREVAEARRRARAAPLFAALATEIHYTAAQDGQASPAGRLDPPLLTGLDEVTQPCPVGAVEKQVAKSA
jgi:hypothetical protein